MTKQKEKTPEQIAAEKLANAQFKSVSDNVVTDAIGGKAMYDFVTETVKNGELPEVNEDSVNKFKDMYQGQVAKHWGLDKVKLGNMYVESTHGFRGSDIINSLGKYGFTDQALAGITTSEARQAGRSFVQGYHFQDLLPKKADERKQIFELAAKETGLAGLLDMEQVKRSKGGIGALAGIISSAAYEQSKGNLEVDKYGQALASNEQYAPLLNQKAFEKYNK